MDPELSNFAEWGGASAPKEPQALIRPSAFNKSPTPSFTPTKSPLASLPKNGVSETRLQPLPGRPDVHSRREEQGRRNTTQPRYSDVVKKSSNQNPMPKEPAPSKSNAQPRPVGHLKHPVNGPAPSKFNSVPRQKDHLKHSDIPSYPTHRNERRPGNHTRTSSASRSQNGSTTTRRNGKSKEEFAKVRPRDVAEEERNEIRDTIAKESAQFTEPLEPSISLPYELWFFWPDGAVDIEKLRSDYDQTLLREIRSKYHCRITFDASSKVVRCSAEKEGDLELLQERFLGLYREFTSSWNDLNVINFFNVPTFENYSDWINVPMKSTRSFAGKGSAGRTAHLAKPEMDEERPASHRQNEISHQRSKSLRANNRLMRKAIEICIKDLRLTEQHVRMRLQIGEIFLSRYRNSANMKHNRNPHVGDADQRYLQYSLEEFEDMISEELAEMEFRNIPSSSLDYKKLAAEISTSGIFTGQEESYTVDFDFIQPNSKQILRFVVEYQKSHTAGELEVSQTKWLEIPANHKYLALNVLDFESYDIQFLITALKRCTNPAILSQLEEFGRSVTFTLPEHGQRSELRRRSKFSYGTRPPNTVYEKSIMTYSIKNSHLKFEITRYDIFENPASLPFLKTARGPTSEWGFTLYDPEWDTKLGELAYLEAGQEVTWPRTLKTFFRGHRGEVTSKEGFKKFVADVVMVNEFLSSIGRDDE